MPGEGWERIGVASVTAGGDILSIAISPNYEADKTIFIGISGGGLWRSSDRGETGTWRQCWGVPCDATVTGIALPRNYQYGSSIPVFAVTNEGVFYRSDDDFETTFFEHTFLDKLGVAPIPCKAIVVGDATSFDGNIYVATWGYGVWGNSWAGDPGGWANISPSTPDLDYCNSLSITSEATQKLWAASSDAGYSIQLYSGSNVWVSKTPISLAEYDVLTIHASWANPANMWVGTALKGMWRSMDFGGSWLPACDGSYSPQSSFEVRAVGDCPNVAYDSEIWEGRSDGMRTSMDLGSNCADGVPNSPVNVIRFAPAYHGTGNYCEAFVGTTDGLYRISCPSAGHPVPKGPIVVDGNTVAVAFHGRGAFMGSLSHGLFKSVDNQTMVEYNNFPNKMKPQIVAVCLDPLYDEFGSACTDQSTLFVGANFIDSPSDNGIYKSVDAGNSWTKMTGGDWPTTAFVRDLAISPSYVTDGKLYAAVNSQLFRWDGTQFWTRVATESNWEDIRMVGVPPGYDYNGTCDYGTPPDVLAGVPCHTVFVSATKGGIERLYYSHNNASSFAAIYPIDCPGGPACPKNVTGIAFPSNFGTGSSDSLRIVVSSSTNGVLTSLGTISSYPPYYVTWTSWTALNTGLPVNSSGGINVNDIAADPDWIDGATPTDPVLNCAVAEGSTANPKIYGPYHTDSAGASWDVVEPLGHAVSVTFETRYPGESHQLAMVGFLQQAMDGYTNPPWGAFFSSNGGFSYTELTGYYSLPNDVYSSVSHERNPNFVFASSPSMGVFVSEDKGETFRPYNTGKGGTEGPCYLRNGYGITMLANRRGLDLDAIYVGTEDGIKSRYIYYDASGSGTVHLNEESPGVANGWRHSTLYGGGNTTGYWERLEVVPNSSLNYPIWAVSPEKGSVPGQGFAALPAGSYEGWVFQNSGLPSNPSAKGVRVGFESGSGGVQPLISGSPIKGSVRQGEWDYYSIEVTDASKDLQVFLQDPDGGYPSAQQSLLWVRYGDLPTQTLYDYPNPHYYGDESACAVPILGENFDEAWGPYGNNPPPGWTILDFGDESPATWNENDWHRYANGTYGYSARVYYNPLENQSDELRSPLFTIPASMTSASLEFDHYLHIYNPTGESGTVWFISDQTSWTILTTYTADTYGMVHASLNLTPFIGNTNCLIVFQYQGYNGWWWTVDNFRVTGIRTDAVWPYGPQQLLKTGKWYIGVSGYENTDNGYTLTATLDTGCTGSFSENPGGETLDISKSKPPDPKAPAAGTTWGTVNGSGVYKGLGSISLTESMGSGPSPSAITWLLRNGSTSPLTNLKTKTIIQLPDTALILGCDASADSDKGIWYSPSGNEGQTTWHQASAVAPETPPPGHSKNFVDVIRAGNGDVLIAASGTGTGTNAGGVWLSGDEGKNWMRISRGFNPSSQELADIVADTGNPVSYYSSTTETGLWTRTVTAYPYPTIMAVNPDFGSTSGMTSVTITGTGFSNSCPTGTAGDCPSADPVVIFGDNNGTTAYEVAGTWVSPTTITATTPAHPAGAVAVRVRNPDTRQTSSGATYTYSVTCNTPSGLSNNSAADADSCADTGVNVSWSDPSDWGDGGSGTRSFDVLRDGGAIATGLSWGLHAYNDTTGTNGVTYTYAIRANNGCGQSSTTSGASAADILCVPPEVAQGVFPDIQSWSGNTQNWPAAERATGYYLYRMLKSDLPNLQSTAEEGCKRDAGTSTSYDCSGDNPIGESGRIYFYLVTGYNGTGEGTGGSGTGFTRNLSTSTTCP